jgi:hypothetical protein
VFCEERIHLVAEYAAALSAYYSAVRELEVGMITGSADIYRNLRQATEEARAVCEVARQKLANHEAGHKCVL